MDRTLSQKKMILEHLKSGKTITPIEALEKYGCFRLSSRIWDLRQDGYVIKTHLISRNGDHFAMYELEKWERNGTEHK